ncbi:RsmE family RNA methyltransferase [Allocoprobacillus halotolerans]|uniref:Ribosomal RNA small subunit methyltransferase E n=1 Tax=Allocoprobacillus halotolerans TaxID=2944914 RepID=A0ABY5I692_9FIRM|nr:RsmE family RNA methyltransferase [Allocoprobacillus halotolerans]
MPELTSLAKLSQLKDYLSDVNLVAYEEESRQGEKTTFEKALQKNYQSITIVIGPEGGFDESEIVKMKDYGFESCALGKRILRSETAPLYMLSVIGFSRELMSSWDL